MGNLAKGVRSESANVGAKWPERNNLADAQSLKPRPALRSGFCSRGMAKAPSTTTGVSFNNSRRLMDLNLRLSVCGFIGAVRAPWQTNHRSRHARHQHASSSAQIRLRLTTSGSDTNIRAGRKTDALVSVSCVLKKISLGCLEVSLGR